MKRNKHLLNVGPDYWDGYRGTEILHMVGGRSVIVLQQT